jgi:hypothetical protein
MSDFLDNLELSVKTLNLLRHYKIDEYQFIKLTKDTWRSMGGLIRGWKEIEEMQSVVKAARIQRLREKTIVRAVKAVRELNGLRYDLANEQLFITKDDRGNFRVGRYITKEDLDEAIQSA